MDGGDYECGVAVAAEAFSLCVSVSEEVLDVFACLTCFGCGVDVGVEDGDFGVGFVGDGVGGVGEEFDVEPSGSAGV